MRPAGVENLALVDQVGEPMGARLLVNLETGPVPFLLHQLVEAGAEGCYLARGERVRDREVAVLVQLLAVLIAQLVRPGPQLPQCLRGVAWWCLHIRSTPRPVGHARGSSASAGGSGCCRARRA